MQSAGKNNVARALLISFSLTLLLVTYLSQNAIKLPVLVSSGLSEAQSICGEFNEPYQSHRLVNIPSLFVLYLSLLIS